MAHSKSKVISSLFCAILVFSAVDRPFAQEPAAATLTVEDLNRLAGEAGSAFDAKNYADAAAKIEELLKGVGAAKEGPIEMFRFNLGLAYLFAEKFPEAEKAFTDCVRQFPKGEYASRCSLGVGRACVAQGTEEKKNRAVEAFKQAATDPKYRTEAGLALGQVYNDLNKPEEALAVFRSLMGSDVRTSQQTNAAVEVLGLLAETGKLDDLIPYLDRVINQPGVRDSIAWYANQVIVRGDELTGTQSFEAALALYRSIPPRRQILETQRAALDGMRKDLGSLQTRVTAEEKLPLNKRSNASEFLSNLKSALATTEEALKAIDEKADLDAALLMRRGRCLYYLDRYEEALICFRTIRMKYPAATDVQTAAYSEIFVYNQLKNPTEVQNLANAYLRKYPEAKNSEQVAMLAAEGLANERKWPELLQTYRDLEKKFPQSQQLDRYSFYQGVALFQDGQFAEAAEVFTKFPETFPNSELIEDALYRVVMANFLSNKYTETLAACEDYLRRFPEGKYAGDIRYRLAFVDYNDKENDQSDKIIKELGAFLEAHPDDLASGAMNSLLGDIYSQKKQGSEDLAVAAYKKAIWSESSDEVVQYAIESATAILQAQKDWPGLQALHQEILDKKAGSPLAKTSATQIAKAKVREGKGREAAELLATFLKPGIADPADEQIELLIDELVKTLMPPRVKPANVNFDEVNAQLVEILNKAAAGLENATTDSRIYYARARLAQMVKQPEKADLFLKGIATTTKDPASLSPVLLSVSGDILIKEGKLDEASAMFQRLTDRYKESPFSDAGPVGLGEVAMARKNYEEAYKIFDDTLNNSGGMSRYKEATLGKLRAMIELGKLDEAEKLALDTMGDKSFRGEATGRAYLSIANVYRKRAAKQNGDAKAESFKKAHSYYQQCYVRNMAFPDVAAEAYWGAYEVLKEMGGQAEVAAETLKQLAENPKLQKTERSKQARELAPKTL